MREWMTVAALLVAGCTPVELRSRPVAQPEAAAVAGEPITLATGPCFGTCPVYRVTIRADGSGTFEGQRFTEVTGTRAFTADPATYRRFAALLARYRPQGERRIVMGSPDCPVAPTDMPSAQVRWGERDTLDFYYGCRTGNEALATALRDAPALLPIAGFIKAK